jgi:hypothetical protein
LECKETPYQLSQQYQKQELAKDVAALANAEGGIILLGVRTERDNIHRRDEIRRISPFHQHLIDTSQYHQVLGSWIYPTLQGATVEWFPSSKNQRKGIGAINIPNQPATKKPFLLTRTIDDKEKRAVVASRVGVRL